MWTLFITNKVDRKKEKLMKTNSIDDFWYYINERHSIYLKRKNGEKSPWTDDTILQKHKFPNVFRELDRTTIAIRQVMRELYNQHQAVVNRVLREPVFTEKKSIEYQEEEHERLIKLYISNQLINIVLYRIFNDYRNCRFGPIYNPTAFYYFMKSSGNKHLRQNTIGEYIETCRVIVSDVNNLIKVIQDEPIWLYGVWNIFNSYPYITEEIAYEIVCDLRYTDILRNAKDTLTWGYLNERVCNALERLGLKLSLEVVKDLWWNTIDHLSLRENNWIENHLNNKQYPYWELREVITCLEQFDRYCEIKEYGMP